MNFSKYLKNAFKKSHKSSVGSDQAVFFSPPRVYVYCSQKIFTQNPTLEENILT